MAFRIHRNGVTIEADTVEDVRALVNALDAPLLPLMRAPKARAKAARRGRSPLPRGASEGSLEGRVLAALAKGPLSPGELCADVKSERYDVLKVVKALAHAGKIRVEGATSNRRIALTKLAAVS